MAIIQPTGTDPGLDAIIIEAIGDEDVVQHWYELGEDSGGEPAVWVWLVVPDEAVGARPQSLLQLSDRVTAALRQHGRFWPYVYFRSRSEQAALAP